MVLETSFEELQEIITMDGNHGGHLGYRNAAILAILNCHVALMPPTKFRFNPTYRSRDIV